MYEITGLPPSDFPEEVERYYEDPRHMRSDLELLRYRFPDVVFAVLRDGVLAAEASFDEDVRRFEIHLTMGGAEKLPGGYRRGWGTDQDDFAAGADGPTRVWRPPNPEE